MQTGWQGQAPPWSEVIAVWAALFMLALRSASAVGSLSVAFSSARFWASTAAQSSRPSIFAQAIAIDIVFVTALGAALAYGVTKWHAIKDSRQRAELRDRGTRRNCEQGG